MIVNRMKKGLRLLAAVAGLMVLLAEQFHARQK